MMKKAWKPMAAVIPAARSLAKSDLATRAVRSDAPTSMRNAITMPTVPSSPSSSPMAAKMKSLEATGMSPGWPRPRPEPTRPPEPKAY